MADTHHSLRRRWRLAMRSPMGPHRAGNGRIDILTCDVAVHPFVVRRGSHRHRPFLRTTSPRPNRIHGRSSPNRVLSMKSHTVEISLNDGNQAESSSTSSARTKIKGKPNGNHIEDWPVFGGSSLPRGSVCKRVHDGRGPDPELDRVNDHFGGTVNDPIGYS